MSYVATLILRGCEDEGSHSQVSSYFESWTLDGLSNIQKDDAKEYMKTCLTCQQNWTLNKKQAGLLRPLPIPEGRWESVSMDFMVSLPPSRGFDAIMMVVDRFSKMAHFIPTKDSDTTQETSRLFFTHVFKHHGLPKDIVSNQDPKFTSKFWRTLWKHMGSEFKMNTSFRPQTNGQTKRVNLVIQQS